MDAAGDKEASRDNLPWQNGTGRKGVVVVVVVIVIVIVVRLEGRRISFGEWELSTELSEGRPKRGRSHSKGRSQSTNVT